MIRIERRETVADLVLKRDSLSQGEDLERKMKILQMEDDPSRGPPVRRLKLLDHFQLVALMKAHDLDSYSVSLTDEGTATEESLSQDGETTSPDSKNGQKTLGGLQRQKLLILSKTDLADLDNDQIEEPQLNQEQQIENAIQQQEEN